MSFRWRFILGVVLIMVLSQVIHLLDGIFALSYYTDPANINLWSKIMMPEPGPPPASFFLFAIAFNLISSLFFTFVYAVLKHGIPGSTSVKKGAMYGLLTVLVATIPSAFAMILIMNLPIALIVLWSGEDLVAKIFGGMILGKMKV